MRSNVLLMTALFLRSIVAFAQENDSSLLEKKRPFGPVIKFEPTGMIHNYSEILVGIEYFVSRHVSVQHHVGPVVSVENYNFKTKDYDNFWGIAFNNEVRYYYSNSALRNMKLNGRPVHRNIKAFYAGVEMDFNRSRIDASTILWYNCGLPDCSYYQKVDDHIVRNWFGTAVITGAHFVIRRKLSLDINGGIGIRKMWMKQNEDIDEAENVYRGVDIDDTQEVVPYPTIGFNIGYCLW